MHAIVRQNTYDPERLTHAQRQMDEFRRDPLFTERSAGAYREKVPSAEVHLLDAGHFALDIETDAIGALVRGFLARLPAQS
jgi:hypothetical protein